MTAESAENPNKKGILQSLGKIPGAKEGALVAGLLASEPSMLNNFGHAGVIESAEIGEKESWSSGVKKLFKAAEDKPADVMTYYIQSKRNESLWLKLAGGKPSATTALPAWGELIEWDESKFIDKIKNLKGMEEGYTLCPVHTHGRGAMKQLQQNLRATVDEINDVDTRGRVSVPPSAPDLVARDPLMGTVRSNTAGTMKYVRMIVDPSFISYYHTFSSPVAQENFMRSLKLAQPRPVHNSNETIKRAQREWLRYVNTSNATSGQIINSSEYDQLRHDYGQFGIHLRLVPREQFEKEPPCAGSNYLP